MLTSVISLIINKLGKRGAWQCVELLSVTVTASLCARPADSKIISNRVVSMSDNSSCSGCILFRWQELVKVAKQL